ncbi:hypothetical protein BGV48_20820 [Burkholderia ubonensis]|nr:hypothetical protein BGV48_20820 [Burkholderia ubonensis]
MIAPECVHDKTWGGVDQFSCLSRRFARASIAAQTLSSLANSPVILGSAHRWGSFGSMADVASIAAGQTGSLQLCMTSQRMQVTSAVATQLTSGIGRKISQYDLAQRKQFVQLRLVEVPITMSLGRACGPCSM